jgi:matrixin
MNQHRRKLLQAALPLFALCLFAFPTKATTVVMLSDNELIENSRFIITGTVRSVISAWDDSRTAIWTYVEVRPDRMLKGNLSGHKIVLKQLGGIAGLSGLRVYGQAKFERGQKILLFLNTGPDGTLRVAHLSMGLFQIVEENGTGEQIVTREVEASEVEILSRPETDTVTNRAPLGSFINKIENKLRRDSLNTMGVGSSATSQPVVEIPAEYPRIKKEASGFSPEFAFLGGGVRWMEADSGQAISFLLNSNNAPLAGGVSAEINRAMAAWPAQSGANIRLQVVGQTGNCGLVTDHTNTISFGDCLGQLDPPVGCSGVVAITSTQYINVTKQVGGQTFYSLVESDVVFNKGMECFLFTSANVAEVACHELGHAIGLAHSGDSTAIMAAVAHGQGRDATLNDDDKAGALAIYPAAPGGGGGGGTGGGGGGGGTGGGGGGGGAGGGGGTPLSITTFSLGNGFVGRTYKQTLNATGGTAPYRWSLIGGLPSGLTLSLTGTIEGAPTKAGTYSVSVQVFDSDSTLHTDAKRISLLILDQNGNTPSAPVITKIKAKGSKKLWVFGLNFNQSSIIILNGIVLSPKSFEQDGATGQLFYKGKDRNIGPSGTNQIVVQNSDSRSFPFTF